MYQINVFLLNKFVVGVGIWWGSYDTTWNTSIPYQETYISSPNSTQILISCWCTHLQSGWWLEHQNPCHSHEIASWSSGLLVSQFGASSYRHLMSESVNGRYDCLCLSAFQIIKTHFFFKFLSILQVNGFLNGYKNSGYSCITLGAKK